MLIIAEFRFENTFDSIKSRIPFFYLNENKTK